MTKTKPYKLTRDQYSKIILAQRIRRSKWIYLLCIAVGLFFLLTKEDFTLSKGYISIFLLVYPFIVLIAVYFWTRSKKLAPIFEEMNLSFDNEYIYMERNGSESKVPYANIQRVQSEKDHWMLYVAKGMFIHVSKDIFYSEKDFTTFESYLYP